MSLSFKGHTVVITGAGGGLGKTYVIQCSSGAHNTDTEPFYSYALLFASRGANVVVNDFNPEAAQKVVDEIKKGTFVPCFVKLQPTQRNLAGGKAVINSSSVTDGAAVIKTAVDVFGGVTILINNAGILRDKG
jgi:multifunctional beta-oxidation protein